MIDPAPLLFAIKLKLALGWTLFASILVNIALVGWMIWRARGIKRYLFIYWGGGFVLVALKFGQSEYVWNRPDGTQVAFSLDPQWGMPLGALGRCWIGNGRTGQFMKYRDSEKRWVAVSVKDAGAAAKALGADPENNMVDGALVRIDVEPQPVFPDGAWFADVIQDKRERKWAQAHEDRGATVGKAVPWIMVGIFAIAAVFFLPKLIGGG